MIQIAIEDIERLLEIEVNLSYIKGRMELINEIKKLNGDSLEDLLEKIEKKSNEEVQKLMTEYDKALSNYASLLENLDGKYEPLEQTEEETQ